jgi:hypothetical protein
MAQGDVKSDLQTIANTGILTIQPAPGEEWVIHNIYYTQAVSFRLAKSGTFLSFDSDTAAGARYGVNIHLTNTQYLQVLNTYAGNNVIAYDGVQTK